MDTYIPVFATSVPLRAATRKARIAFDVVTVLSLFSVQVASRNLELNPLRLCVAPTALGILLARFPSPNGLGYVLLRLHRFLVAREPQPTKYESPITCISRGLRVDCSLAKAP